VSNTTRLIVVVLVVLICLFLPLWKIVHPGEPEAASRSRLLIAVVLVFCFVPIYPLYRKARSQRWSRAVPLLLVVGALVLIAVEVFMNFVYPPNACWVTLISELRTATLAIACVLFIRNAVASRKTGGGRDVP
jgi:hypothetical protein